MDATTPPPNPPPHAAIAQLRRDRPPRADGSLEAPVDEPALSAAGSSPLATQLYALIRSLWLACGHPMQTVDCSYDRTPVKKRSRPSGSLFAVR